MGMKLHFCQQVLKPSADLAEQHYQEHQGKPFYPGLVEFLTSGPVVSSTTSCCRHIVSSRANFTANAVECVWNELLEIAVIA